MADKKPPMPKEWDLERLIAGIREAAPKVELVSIEDLRRQAAGRAAPKLPELDSLQSALGRIVEAIHGKPLEPQTVVVGKFRDGRPRHGGRVYSAYIPVRDALAVGQFLESKGAHDGLTRMLYQGALNAKWGSDDAPHYIQQQVPDLFHMLQVAKAAGA